MNTKTTMKYSIFSAALLLLMACGPSKKTQEDKSVERPTATENTPASSKPASNNASAGNDTNPNQNTKPGKPVLHGSWELEKVYGAKEPFNMLFPNKKPTATFDLKENRINGNTGCNQYNGAITLRNGVLSIGDVMSTRMFCEGVKEELFLTTIKMTNGYKFEGDKLLLTLDEQPTLGFKPIK